MLKGVFALKQAALDILSILSEKKKIGKKK